MSRLPPPPVAYRGRIAPSPTGFLHLGHARTFWTAFERARGGTLILRNEDIDRDRCKTEFVSAFVEDLQWLGIRWQEGPGMEGPHAPYDQSRRRDHHLRVLESLHRRGLVFPCTCSRREIRESAAAPHEGREEPVYPGTCRGKSLPTADVHGHWRFRVTDGEVVSFEDEALGPQCFTAGKDFGDFPVWRKDNTPSYQLAVVADDAAMGITEVVRGADLLLSTARQILLYRALGLVPPRFYHCPLMTDAHGLRLAKRHDALSLRELRRRGHSPESVRALFAQTP
ncbi:MAG: tRNA glutamyl-Q(34) synthetase GluQRS [Verrucomicrobiae bacterium]|nr:tRNA glutamyl-Q(34) synthetase GluQRS [Verrucomicrobiae bacterium]